MPWKILRNVTCYGTYVFVRRFWRFCTLCFCLCVNWKSSLCTEFKFV